MIRLVAQRAGLDCGVASLATLLTRSYDEVREAVDALGLHLRRGLRCRDMERVAAHLGVELRRERPGTWDAGAAHAMHFAGIVKITYPGRRIGHYVVLWEGMAYDLEDLTVTPWDLYLPIRGARAATRLSIGRYLPPPPPGDG